MSICTICFGDSPDGNPHPACVETGPSIEELLARTTEEWYRRIIAEWPSIQHIIERRKP